MGITFQEVIDNELISEEVLEYIPTECPVCDNAIMFTDSLKQIYCPNRFCSLKIAARLESMAKAMKADGWGESTCQAVAQHFQFTSPYQVFLLNDMDAECPDVSAFKKKVASICNPEIRRVKLWEVVRLAGIPSIETTAYKIFDGFENLAEAYEAIEKLQVPFIAERLGIKNADTGVMAVSVYNTLIEYKNELLFGETKFEVYKAEGIPMLIAITGGVEGYHNKSEYIQYINNRYAGKLSATLTSSVSSSINVLVADGDTSSNKYRQACKLRDKNFPIVITTSGELIRTLDKQFMEQA